MSSKPSMSAKSAKSAKTSIDELPPFSNEYFDKSGTIWMANKVYLPSKGLTLYYTFSDSPISWSELKTHTPKHPNMDDWYKCGYISSDGKICHNKGIIFEDEITVPRTEYDHEKYTVPHLCESHCSSLKKETRRRIRHMELIIKERTNK